MVGMAAFRLRGILDGYAVCSRVGSVLDLLYQPPTPSSPWRTGSRIGDLGKTNRVSAMDAAGTSWQDERGLGSIVGFEVGVIVRVVCTPR